MKRLLYALFIPILLVLLLYGLATDCPPTTQAQDATPTPESLTVRSFGYRGVPVIPARQLVILGALDYYGLTEPVVYRGFDLVGDTVYTRYDYSGGCFVLEWRAGNEQVGADGYPHPNGSFLVECDS